MTAITIHPDPETSARRSDMNLGLPELFAEIAQGAAERDRERILPFDVIAKLRDARFGAYRLPREAGGAGATHKELYAQVMALGSADSNVAHILRNHFVFVERFALHPDRPQGFFWQQKIAEGKIFGLANAELAKARSGGVSVTRLKPDGDSYRLNGVKFYSTGSLYADFVIVRARDLEDHPLTVVIPTDREGITLVDDWDSSGQRLTGTGTSVFENVLVEADEVVWDEAGKGYGRAYKSTLPQIFLTAVNAGILRAILRDARSLLHQRVKKAFSFAAAEVPAEDPLLLKIVGELSSQVSAAETLVSAGAEAQDRVCEAEARGDDIISLAHDASIMAAKAKVIVDDFVLKAGNQIFDLGGASSLLRSVNLDRHWRNARTIASHNPALFKALALGRHEIHGTPLPDADFF